MAADPCGGQADRLDVAQVRGYPDPIENMRRAAGLRSRPRHMRRCPMGYLILKRQDIQRQAERVYIVTALG